jgi:hypothetical protein
MYMCLDTCRVDRCLPNPGYVGYVADMSDMLRMHHVVRGGGTFCGPGWSGVVWGGRGWSGVVRDGPGWSMWGVYTDY